MRPTIAYQPALDGVRALAVIAVLLFHAGVGGFSGGYLGVSVFFTLSGYLITSLLLNEHATTGRIDLAAFYSRRLRRLLPASALCLAVIVVVARVTDLFERVEGLRGQVLGAILQVANWVFLAGDGSYQDLLAQEAGAASPLEHFWSLAIEEQFYWVWPPFVMLLFARVANPRRRFRTIVVITLAFMLAAPLIAVVWGPDAAYWATPARIGEILVGAWIAAALANRNAAPDPRWRWAAPGALAALAIAVVTFPAAGGPAYHGALPLVALASGALLVGLQADGPVRRALSWGPLVYIGKISYGVYLFHWPLFVLLDQRRTGWDGPALLVLRLGLTLAVSVVSFRWFESPIRHARGRRVATFVGSLAATTAVAVAAVTVVPLGLGEYWRTDADTAEAAAIDPNDTTPLVVPSASPTPTTTLPTPSPTTQPTTDTAPGSTDAPDPTDAPTTIPPTIPASSAPSTPAVEPVPPMPRPVRILVIGDSTANALGTGIVNWAAANPDRAQAEVVAAPGCGFLQGGERLVGERMEATSDCDGWVADLVIPEITALQPDVVVAMVTSWDLIDRRWDDGPLLTPFDPAYAEHLRADYSAVVDGALAAGAGSVALIRHPVPDVWWLHDRTGQSDPVRHDAIFGLYDELSSGRPTVRVVDLAGWLGAQGLDTDQATRPDGIHLDPASATALTEAFLGEELLRVVLGMPGAWSDAP